ncbi:unnamed protein product [Amoebophrya sp. A120]|nr:unnamed protein product [Amoebophrya sp. A120]|eukprot:GSA120T00014306001.1
MEVTNVNEEPNSAFGGRTRVAVPSDPEVDSDGTGSTTSWHTCTSPVFLHETENICSSPVFASKPKVPAKPPPPTGTPSARVGSVKPPLPPTRSQVKLLEQRKKRHQRAVAAAALRGAMSAEEAQAFIRENYAMIVLRNWARRCVQEKREKVEMLRKQLETQTKPETCCGPKYRHHAADRALEELQKKPLYSFSEWYSNRSPVKRRGSRSGERRTRQARNPMHETGVSVGEVANAGRLARTM